MDYNTRKVKWVWNKGSKRVASNKNATQSERKTNKKIHKLWIVSVITSIIFLSSIIMMWNYIIFSYKPASNQITKLSELPEILKKYEGQFSEKPFYIPTGFFIQSFYFRDPLTVIFSGVIWQKYPKEVIKKGIRKALVLPEINARLFNNLAYQIDYPDYELIGWDYTAVSLYQQFDYSRYPLDQQTIRIRVIPRDFNKNILLVPDLAAYTSTRPYEIFGLDKNIIPGAFQLQETYFSFIEYSSDTNFGIKDFHIDRMRMPELMFNIVIKRNFLNSFLLYLLPVIVVWGLLFGLTMVMSSDPEKANAFKFATTSSLTTLAGTFFSILIAQMSLRSNFIGQPVTYIEFFYFITYVVIFLLALNAFLVTAKKSNNSFVTWENNLLPKILFWPVIFGSMAIITYIKFFI